MGVWTWLLAASLESLNCGYPTNPVHRSFVLANILLDTKMISSTSKYGAICDHAFILVDTPK
ncbi:hypothetical protein BDZ94DRAFT_1258481 [Collybia nuda]|uniref:Uncharacterized protein n=1 Tax=Collybia nuda TaxID=64659 RepID=A0A9P6CF07_9AGAR|nr:hypothetical protein BDZ94DRAFT_1258481 [Collybia nuda]